MLFCTRISSPQHVNCTNPHGFIHFACTFSAFHQLCVAGSCEQRHDRHIYGLSVPEKMHVMDRCMHPPFPFLHGRAMERAISYLLRIKLTLTLESRRQRMNASLSGVVIRLSRLRSFTHPGKKPMRCPTAGHSARKIAFCRSLKMLSQPNWTVQT